ncbi:MAG: hypothetical protein FJX77_17600, partial [Armatimonadetes bacterium]|nr:hypothetical protein [Armatimonadota bacterium]
MTSGRWGLLAVVGLLSGLLAGPGSAQEEGPAHVHGPDGRHIAVGETGAGESPQGVLSHHDLRITDTRRLSPSPAGAVVTGAAVVSEIHRRGAPGMVLHREKNAYEPENGVYGSHMTYRAPGEYQIVERITIPGGEAFTVAFPIWVPGPSPPATRPVPPWQWAAGAAGGLLLLGLAFYLGRRSTGRPSGGLRSAPGVGVLLCAALGLLPPGGVRAQEAEHGHAPGPDGQHGAVEEPPDAPGTPIYRAYLGPNREIEAFAVRGPYRFRLSIENELLGPPDPDLVSLDEETARVIGLEVATARVRPLAGGLTTTGRVLLNPNGTVSVNAPVAGRVVRLFVTPGQEVRA